MHLTAHRDDIRDSKYPWQEVNDLESCEERLLPDGTIIKLALRPISGFPQPFLFHYSLSVIIATLLCWRKHHGNSGVAKGFNVRQVIFRRNTMLLLYCSTIIVYRLNIRKPLVTQNTLMYIIMLCKMHRDAGVIRSKYIFSRYTTWIQNIDKIIASFYHERF